MQSKFIKEFNKKFPFFKDFYYRHYSTFKYFYFMARHQLGILRPNWVQWLATYNCNFTCKHCEANAGNVKAEELTTAQICRVIDDFAKLKTMLYVSGGEPLVREDLFEVIKYAKKNNVNYGIATNCSLVEKHGHSFERLMPNFVFTSIDGLNGSHDEFRGAKGSFTKSMEAIKFFRKIGVNHITINTFVYPGNLNELEDLKSVIFNCGATKWRLSLAIPVGRAKTNGDFYLSNEQIEYLFNFIHKESQTFNVQITEDAGFIGRWERVLRRTAFFCGAGFSRCSIMPDGEVLGCQIAYDNRLSEGNVKQRSFSDIWRNEFKKFRYPNYEDNKECPSCRYFHACRGGCWGMRLGNKHCLKGIWEKNEVCNLSNC